jgi:hypothetical protein
MIQCIAENGTNDVASVCADKWVSADCAVPVVGELVPANDGLLALCLSSGESYFEANGIRTRGVRLPYRPSANEVPGAEIDGVTGALGTCSEDGSCTTTDVGTNVGTLSTCTDGHTYEAECAVADATCGMFCSCMVDGVVTHTVSDVFPQFPANLNTADGVLALEACGWKY